MNAGVRNPGRNALIALLLLVASLAGLGGGILSMVLTGRETAFSVFGIALGIVGSVVFFAFLLNFTWGVRVMNAMRRGENVIARWTVPADDFDRFRENEKRHAAEGHPNDYKPPRRTPPRGVEVIFATDGMIIGDTFFGLATTGMSHIRQAGISPDDPLCLGFQTAMVSGRVASTGSPHLNTVLGLLRIPVPASAHPQAKAVLDHYIAALAGQVIVRPDFWRRRLRWGLWAALVSAVVAATGFALNAVGAELGELPLIMSVAGTVAGIGGLVLALIAWSLASQERRGRGSDGRPA